MMYGSVWIPDWPVTAAELAEEVPAHTAAAVCAGRGGLATNSWARAAGIRVGMGRRAAHAACPEATLLSPDRERDASRFEPVLRALDRHIARITVMEPGTVIFAARGAIRSAGSPQLLAEAIVGEVADVAGCESYVGFGEGTLATLLAARTGTVLQPGASLPFIVNQPVKTLLMPFSTAQARSDVNQCLELLRKLGIVTVGEVRELGAPALSSRFGRIGLTLWQLASGNDAPLEVTGRSPAQFTCSRSFEPPLHTTDSAAFAAKELAGELGEEMTARNLGGGRLTISAALENGNQYERSWLIEGGGVRDVVDRVRWQLGSWIASDEEGSDIIRLELLMSDLQVSGQRPDTLWGGRTVGDEQASRSAARMQALLGEESVHLAEKMGGRTPREEFAERSWSEAPSRATAASLPWPGAVPHPAPTIVFPDPHHIDLVGYCGHSLIVTGDGMLACSDGCTGEIRPARMLEEHVSQPIIDFAGPWIIEQRWWDPRRSRRAYLQTVSESVAALIYREDEAWYVEGLYA